MVTEYKLGKTGSGRYQQLACSEYSEAIVRCLDMFGFGDCIGFWRRNNDGSTFGSNWGLGNLERFGELAPYRRLTDMPGQDVEKLAANMHRLLYGKNFEYDVNPPRITDQNPEYRQILGELRSLQETQRRLLESGEIAFPGISAEEFACPDLW